MGCLVLNRSKLHDALTSKRILFNVRMTRLRDSSNAGSCQRQIAYRQLSTTEAERILQVVAHLLISQTVQWFTTARNFSAVNSLSIIT
jgi:hypothetical protein